MRQELCNAADWMGGQARENIRKPSKRIDFDPLARCHETPEHGSGLATLVTAEEGPVVSTDGHNTEALGMIIVDLEIAVSTVAA